MDYIFQVEKDERSPADIAYVKSKIDVVKRMSYEREMQLEMILARLWHICLQMFSSSRHREKKVVMWFVNYLILFFEYHIVHVSYGTPKPKMVDG